MTTGMPQKVFVEEKVQQYGYLMIIHDQGILYRYILMLT